MSGDDELQKSLPYIKNFRNALDIGSCVGDTVKDFSTKFKHVYGFEPLKETYGKLIENTKHLTNVTCYNYAVGEKADELEISNLKLSPTRNKILDKEGEDFLDGYVKSRNLGFHLWSREKVKSIDIDNFKFTDIDFIKIDTEGYVLPVLKGMKNTLLENNYPPLFVEIDNSFGGLQDVLKWFKDLGYSKESVDRLNYIFYFKVKNGDFL